MTNPGHRNTIDLSQFSSGLSFSNKLARVLWGIVWGTLGRPSPIPCFAWRRLLLRCFGAKVGRKANIYPSCKVWAPWNLELGDYSCISHSVDCYSVDKVRIGAHATISQYSFLCSASHDISHPQMALTTSPIAIQDYAWVCADVFIGPGVTIGEGAVVGARSSVFKNVPPWVVVGGNPARHIKDRKIRESST